MAQNKKLSLVSRGLNYKLKIAFNLMSILPLLICIYLVSSYIIPYIGLKFDIIAAIAISIIIAGTGFFVLKEVFDRVLNLSNEAKLMAAGDMNRSVVTGHEDEVGDLGSALNQLTMRIRSNMDELKQYSERSAVINIEIQKRVVILSGLLNISTLFSEGAKLNDLLRVITDKARLIADSDVSYLFYRDEGYDIFKMKNINGLSVNGLLKFEQGPGDGAYEFIAKLNNPIILDNSNKISRVAEQLFCETLGLKCALAIPLYFKGRVTGVLGVGRRDECRDYANDDIEMLDIFAKQAVIAIENDALVRKAEKLEIKDALTGLYNASFIRERLQEEIKRAIVYQRPCAYILLNIDNFRQFEGKFGALMAEAVLRRVATLIKNCVSDVDRVGRVSMDEFVLILPEKNKRQSKDLAESIRKTIEFAFSEEQDPAKRLTVSGGISENPLDGITAEELINKAEELLKTAKSGGKNRIVYT
jgi:diguanylate cyclase (GGDEF)-like protein